jgi:hypothetical protein
LLDLGLRCGEEILLAARFDDEDSVAFDEDVQPIDVGPASFVVSEAKLLAALSARDADVTLCGEGVATRVLHALLDRLDPEGEGAFVIIVELACCDDDAFGARRALRVALFVLVEGEKVCGRR